MTEKYVLTTLQTDDFAQAANESSKAFQFELAAEHNASKNKTDTQKKTTAGKDQEVTPPIPPIPPPPRFPDPFCRPPFDPMCPEKPDPLPQFPKQGDSHKDKNKDKPKH